MQSRVRVRFEDDWKFFKGNDAKAFRVKYDDSGWRLLDLPHDWSIEGPFDSKCRSGGHGGYLPGGIGWYRKSFALPAADRGKRVVIEFDGVYMNSDVWINGHRLGRHAYGYTPFSYDLTPYLKFGRAENVLAVKVNNSRLPVSRWYSGSGIYRHVWLTVTGKLYVPQCGTVVTTPQITDEEATVAVTTTVCNETDSTQPVRLVTRIVGRRNRVVATVATEKRVRAGQSCAFDQETVVTAPALWDVDAPNLYRTVTQVTVGDKVLDEVETPFGIRTCRFDPNEGFFLNGRHLKLKGVNLHHDNGCLGSVVHDRAEERRVELMKSIGVNAIRTSHNPPSPGFLDACDRLGVVVMDEAFDEWEEGKLRYGYKDVFTQCWRDDLSSFVLRDRNHPSVVLWSIGNEVPEQGKLKGARTAAKMARLVRRLDPTRPVGYGAHPGPWTPQLWDALDVCGYNYRDDLYATDHEQYPERCILGSETFSLHAFQTWARATENRNIIGEFIWTGMDYIGESGIGHAKQAHAKFPVNTACCGELDICGFKKTRSYYRDILWDNGTLLHIAVRRRLADGEAFKLSPWGWPEAKSSWTWPDAERSWPSQGDGHDIHVDVYSACDEVELRLNGRTIGRHTTSHASRHMASWVIAYERGTLEAVGYRAGEEVARQVLRTAGEPAKLRLTPDRRTIAADGCDLSFVTVEVLDRDGTPHPNADNELRFSVTGPGEIIGLGNGDPASLEPFQGRRRTAYNGRCLVVIKSKRGAKPGKIKLKAQAKGIRPAATIIRTREA